MAAHYRFLHTLHHSLWYDQVSTALRRQLHRRIGEREEEIYGARTPTIATELAVHLTEGGDYERAVRYLRMAAELTTERYAYREGIEHLSHGLELLAALPDTPEKTRQELELQTALSWAQGAVEDQADIC